MSRARSILGFANRYVTLAGQSCCAGRSWVGLDRSLERRAAGPPTGPCRTPHFSGPDEAEQFVLATRPDEPEQIIAGGNPQEERSR